MKNFICDFLSTISMVGGLFGMILVMNGAIEKSLAFALMFFSMFLWFGVDCLKENIGKEDEAEGNKDVKEREK